MAWPYAIDVFSGAGLMGLGFQVEGFDVAEHCEYNRAAVETLNANYGLRLRPCDAEKWVPRRSGKGEIDLLFGGPPCQPHSRGGKRRGEDDPKDKFHLTWKWAELYQPRYMVWENAGIESKTPAYVAWRKRFWDRMRKLGYEGTMWVLRASDYGTPQLRQRAFLVLWRKGDRRARERLSTPPPPTHARPDLADELGLLPWVSAHSRLHSGCCGRYALYTCRWLNNDLNVCSSCLGGGNYAKSENESWGENPPQVYVVPNKFGQMELLPAEPLRYLAEPQWRGALTEDQLKSLLHLSEVPKESRLHLSKHVPADFSGTLEPRPRRRDLGPTMAASMSKGIPYGLVIEPGVYCPTPEHIPGVIRAQLKYGTPGIRFLSIREAAKLQDCPQSYVFRGSLPQQLKQVGNAVPVNLARAVARHVLWGMGRRRPRAAFANDPHSGLWAAYDDEHPCRPAERAIMELRGQPYGQMELIPAKRLKRR